MLLLHRLLCQASAWNFAHQRTTLCPAKLVNALIHSISLSPAEASFILRYCCFSKVALLRAVPSTSYRGWLARVETSAGDLPAFQRLSQSLSKLAAKHDIQLTRDAEQVSSP